MMSIIIDIGAIGYHSTTSAGRGHHLRMMCDGSSAEEGGKGAGEDNFSMIQIVVVASIDHGGCHCPTAATEHHPQQ
jgi:hypothetical protein